MLSRRVQSLQESAIRKLDGVVAQRSASGLHFHRVNIGQPDVPTPPELLDAAGSFRPEVLAYGPASGTADTRAATAAYHHRWCDRLTAADVAITTGGSEALLFAFTAACDPGDEILAPEPYYTNYNGFATVAGVRVRPIPTRLDDGFAIPPDAELDELVTDRTRAFVFSNPSNPTGAVYGRETVERLANWAQRHGIWLISDEVYRQIWFDAPPFSVLELEHDNLVVVHSLSKAWSACGARLGCLISRNAALMEKVDRLGQARLGPQPLAQAIARAAFALPESYYEDLRATYKARINALLEGLARIEGVSTHRPAGAFYLMCRLPVTDTEAFGRYLATDFEHEGESVVVAPGPGFYSHPSKGRDEIRLAAVLGVPELTRSAELLGLALEQYSG